MDGGGKKEKFDFEPAFFGFYSSISSGTLSSLRTIIVPWNYQISNYRWAPIAMSSTSNVFVNYTINFSNNFVSWYSENPTNQNNNHGFTYFYFAFK